MRIRQSAFKVKSQRFWHLMIISRRKRRASLLSRTETRIFYSAFQPSLPLGDKNRFEATHSSTREMNDISVGAVGAAIIAGIVSLLGLIIGKEQKVSEFRQAWIDDLRKCIVAYLVNINAISDSLRVRKANGQVADSDLLDRYRSLNEASHGIVLRVNELEEPAKALLKSMTDFEEIASDNTDLTPDRIRSIEKSFVKASKELLKFEWKRVKRGERIFVWTKIILSLTIVTMLAIFIYISVNYENSKQNATQDRGVQLISQF